MRVVVQFLLTFLVNASWQIALIVAFAIVCCWILRGAAAWQKHAVWVSALVLSLGLPALTSAKFFLKTSSSKSATQIAYQARPENEPRLETATALTESEPIVLNEPPAAKAELSPARPSFLRGPIEVDQRLAAALVMSYLMFVGYRTLQLLRAWRRTRAIVKTGYSLPVPNHVQAVLAKCQNILRVKHFRILFSAAVPVPVTAGILNPLIILPEDLLREEDHDILSSALGHELVHVARRDYILNLLYELIHLPLAFHPAAAFLRRRVRQTRELCCDEIVAGKLVRPEVYARSLVRLIDAAPLARRLAANTTIGITDADILEVRIMSLLKRSQLSGRRRAVQLIAAALLLATPCLAGGSFAFSFNLANQEASFSQPQDEKKDLQSAREELKRKAEEIRVQAQKGANMSDAEREKLRRLERELQEAATKVGNADYMQQLKNAEQGLREAEASFAQVEKQYPQKEAIEKLAELQRLYPQTEAAQREAQARLKELLTQYPDMKKEQAELNEAMRRLHQEMAEQYVLQEKMQEQKVEKLKEKEHKEKIKEKLLEDKDEQKERHLKEEPGDGVVEMRLRKERAEANRAERSRRQIELTRGASISMDRAIQVATSQYPGKVLACSLGRDAEGRVFYHLVIITGEGEKTATRYVWVSALDGQIMKTENE
jgi:beta-lactamase regulating signal transducer with metallopeptidase domain